MGFLIQSSTLALFFIAMWREGFPLYREVALRLTRSFAMGFLIRSSTLALFSIAMWREVLVNAKFCCGLDTRFKANDDDAYLPHGESHRVKTQH